MKDKLYIKTRLDNLLAEKVPVADEYILPHQAKIEVVNWVYNQGDIKPENIVIGQQKNIQEEIVALNFANDTSIRRKIAEAKLSEINCILN